jgi:hypothetical protein
MRRKNKFIIALSLVLGIFLLSFVIFTSISENFIFVENLSVEEFRPISSDSYAADVLDNGVRVADIYIRAEYPRPQTLDVPVLVSIWHSEETELDSLFLRFYGSGHFNVYLEAPGGGWPQIHFQRASDSRGVTFEVKDLGFQGTGTVTLQFLLYSFSDQNSFNFEVRFSMHENAFLQFTRQEVWASTEIPIPT